KLTVYLRKVDYYYEDDSVSFANTYDWRGQKFELRITEKLMRSKRQIDSTKIPTKKKKHRRLDEPEQAEFVFAHKIDVFNKYLVGTPRHPFQQPRNYFILFVAHTGEGWKKTGAMVLERLWKSYGIIHALLIAPCSITGESVKFHCSLLYSKVIGQYDPFYLDSSITNPLSSSYGRCTWMTVEDFEYDNRLVRKLASLNQFPLRVSLFPRYPSVLLPKEVPDVFERTYFSRVANKTQFYSGVDALVLGNMAEAIDFKPDIVRPSGNDYGYKLSNGTFIGSLGDVLYRRVYISFNTRFISDYGTDDIEYLFPTYFDRVCVIAPKALKVPQWMAIFKCFNRNLWIIILFINTMCGIFWFLLKSWGSRTESFIRSRNRKTYRQDDQICVVSIEMWIIMLGGVSKNLPNRSMERVFLSVCLVSNIIIAGTFQ
ncbi:hypothetical protein Bhyg_16618, partial [Pseudolycoriella hygida]